MRSLSSIRHAMIATTELSLVTRAGRLESKQKPFNSTHLAVATETPLLMQAQCAPAHLQSTRTPVPAAAAAADEGNHEQPLLLRLCERSRRSLRVCESYAGRRCCCLRASRQWMLLFLVGKAGSTHPLHFSFTSSIRAAVVLRVPLVVVVVVALATNTSHHCSL